MDETWIHIYDPETKEQSKEWRHSGMPCPKKFKTQKSSSKVLAPVFWDKDGILLVYYLERGATITEGYYIALLGKMKQQLVSKHRGKLLKGNLFHQDNTAPHKAAITHQKLADLHFEALKHGAYSPDLAPLDYCLFPNLKELLKGRKISSTEEATLAANGCFAAQPKEFLLDRLKKLEQRSHKCMELKGEYVE
jgi:histone-lysine N-methyltransferase SETMAR